MGDKIKIDALQEGQNYRGELLVIESQVKQASNGPYVQLKLTDGVNEIMGKRWKNSSEISPGCVMQFVFEVGSWNGKKDLNIKGWSAGELPVEEFYKKGPVPKTQLYMELSAFMDQITDPHYKEFVEYMYQMYEYEIDTTPAARSVHHDYQGGWLQHTTEVTKLALAMARTMNDLADMSINISLVLAGAMLHDVGKLRGYSFCQGAIDLTDDGKLIEHISLGMLMLSEAQKSLQVPDVCYQMLLHCVCSHHGRLEWGSPVMPATIEAQIIHLADLTSANCTTMHEQKNTGDNIWSDKSYYLGRQVYKGPVGVSSKTKLKILHRDDERAKEIVEELKQNGGYCPCAVDRTADTKCMCKSFREMNKPGLCHCGLYEKIEEA